mmetsp:Transcript_35684/g.114133  ORF Transcript_35684/g.114133 Transcript_35684/m.114133 type:complete len:196 (+) Transcript_35684:480-1067(+)
MSESTQVKTQFGDAKSMDHTYKAITLGFWRALPVGVATVGGTWYMNSRNSFNFRNALGPSGKIFVAIGPPLAAWSYFSEVGIGRELKKELGGGAESEATSDVLPWKLRLANSFYDHTLLTFVSIVLPLYGAVLGHELTKPRPPGWRLSHAIIHTRVIGQAIAVGSLIVVFGGRETLKRNGAPFGVDKDDFYLSNK